MTARAIGFLLVAVIAICAWIASQREVERKQSILITNAEMPKNWPQEHRLFAVCPDAPWVAPRPHVGTHQV
jgi:hypothetical protein